MEFLFRLLLNLLFLILRDIPLILIGIVLLLPICYIQSYQQIKQLPHTLKWFDSADWYVGRNTDVISQIASGSILHWYYWLAIRNPINYFNYSVLGLIPEKTIENIVVINNGDVDDNKQGYRYVEYIIDDKTYYEYYYIGSYIYFRMGHKLGLPKEVKIGNPVQQVFTIQIGHFDV